MQLLNNDTRLPNLLTPIPGYCATSNNPLKNTFLSSNFGHEPCNPSDCVPSEGRWLSASHPSEWPPSAKPHPCIHRCDRVHCRILRPRARWEPQEPSPRPRATSVGSRHPPQLRQPFWLTTTEVAGCRLVVGCAERYSETSERFGSDSGPRRPPNALRKALGDDLHDIGPRTLARGFNAFCDDRARGSEAKGRGGAFWLAGWEGRFSGPPEQEHGKQEDH